MVDEGDPQVIAFDAGRRFGGGADIHPLGPGRRVAAKTPFEEIEKAFLPRHRVEENLAVEMIRCGPVVIHRRTTPQPQHRHQGDGH